MKFLEKVKSKISTINTKAYALAVVGVAGISNFVSAVPVIDNDTLSGMPALGTDLGDFLGNLAPGLGKFMLVIAIFSGIAAIIYGVFLVVKKASMGSRGR